MKLDVTPQLKEVARLGKTKIVRGSFYKKVGTGSANQPMRRVHRSNPAPGGIVADCGLVGKRAGVNAQI